MNAPDFLVIGAMKSGTTTLYHDLSLNPNIFLPDKETNGLATAITRSEYLAKFQAARQSQICGDISTVYAMLPDSSDVVPRAREFLSPDTKIVYIVREPVGRTLSHHNHMRTWTGPTAMGPDINVELRCRPELIDCSRYAMQLAPWIDCFGRSAVHVIVFEDYVQRRKQVIAELSRFLGVEPKVDGIDENIVHNQSDGKPLTVGGWKKIASSPLYRRLIRPMMSLRTRDVLRSWLLPHATDERIAPTEQTIDAIIAGVRHDVDSLSKLLGANRPLWDLDAAKSRYLKVGDTAKPIGTQKSAA